MISTPRRCKSARIARFAICETVISSRRIAAIFKHYQIDPQELDGWLFTDTGRETPICIAEKHKDAVIFTPDAAALTKAIIANKIDVFIADLRRFCQSLSSGRFFLKGMGTGAHPKPM